MTDITVLDSPHVDPYWKRDDAAIVTSVLDVLPKPLWVTDRDKFFQNICQVAAAVHNARIGTTQPLNGPDPVWTAMANAVGYREWNAVPVAAMNFSTAAALARYVLNDDPSALHRAVDAEMVAAGVKPFFFSKNAYTEFHRGPLLRSYTAGLLPLRVNPTTFAAKYIYQVPRPHVVVSAILNGTLDAPSWCEDSLAQYVNTDAVKADKEQFTLVAGATPHHWSYPAMHSATAGAALMRAAVHWDISMDDAITAKVLRTLYQNGLGRTILGVHTSDDNLTGFAIGQAVALQVLPELMQSVGIDPEAVRERLNKFFIPFRKEMPNV